jgi:hypothetical protein
MEVSYVVYICIQRHTTLCITEFSDTNILHILVDICVQLFSPYSVVILVFAWCLTESDLMLFRLYAALLLRHKHTVFGHSSGV